MKKTASVIVFVLFVLIAGAAWIFGTNPAFLTDATVLRDSLRQKRITINHTLPVTVDVADTDAKRIQGLSGRESLADEHGLFMVFDAPQSVGIWMKDMKFSIDVIWADASGKIIWLYPNMDPSSYPQVFGPDALAKYVLEVPAGFIDIHNIKEGDTIEP